MTPKEKRLAETLKALDAKRVMKTFKVVQREVILSTFYIEALDTADVVAKISMPRTLEVSDAMADADQVTEKVETVSIEVLK